MPTRPRDPSFQQRSDVLIVHHEDRATVFVSGQIVGPWTRELRRRLLALLLLPVTRVTIDLGGVTALDAAGVEVLETVREFAVEHAIALELEVPALVTDAVPERWSCTRVGSRKPHDAR